MSTPKHKVGADLSGHGRRDCGAATWADPLRAAGKDERGVTRYPSLDAVARGILQRPEVLGELFRMLAWTDRDATDEEMEQVRRALCQWEKAKAEVDARRRRYLTRPTTEWRESFPTDSV
jgi:hypothetical protein